jgi:hypothetical protein
MIETHSVQESNVSSDLVDIFLQFIVGDSRAFNLVNTENFQSFLAEFVEKL